MPSRRYHNIYQDGAVCVWTSAIVKRVPVLSSPAAARMLISLLDEYRRLCGVKLLGYVIMPDHIHLAVWSEDARKVKRFVEQFLGASSAGIAALAERAANGGNPTAAAWLSTFKSCARKGRAVRVWKERGRAFPLSTDDALLQKVDYMHANPVRAGLVSCAEEWEFSSAGWYAGGTGLLAIDAFDV